jgi:hypothetical protein
VNYLLAFALSLLVTAGCSFKVSGTDSDAASGDVDLATDSTDMANGGEVDMSLTGDVDMSQVCTPAAQTCSAGNVSTCKADGTGFDVTTCALGCIAGTPPRCAQLQPTAPVTRDDFDTTGLTANVVIAGGTTFDTNTGQIGFGTVIRGPNVVPTNREVISGIGFHVVDVPGGSATNPPAKIGVWYFSSVNFQSSATLSRVVGANAMALVSASTMALDSAFDLTCAGNVFVAAGTGPHYAGPGGGNGAAGTDPAGVGAGGGGSDLNNSSGGGGAGYGAAGGIAGKDGGNAAGAAGAAYGAAALAPIRGGSGGGRGGNGTGVGGGGGGAIHIVAQTSVTVGNGANPGGVNASGCGGHVGGSGNGGGGGGSGGAILFESPSIALGAQATLAANGGGGASGGTANGANDGQAGSFGSARANGGNAAPKGGAGGASTTTTGDPGIDGGNSGGGGGGAAGRIRLNTKTSAATIDGSAVLSPRLLDNLATQGPITTN